jgi:hypothetical protein
MLFPMKNEAGNFALLRQKNKKKFLGDPIHTGIFF